MNNEDDWTDAELQKPKRKKWYDLCLLDLGHKVISGWWSGTGWDGLNYKGHSVKRWKYFE